MDDKIDIAYTMHCFDSMNILWDDDKNKRLMADTMVSAGPKTKERVESVLSEARKNRAISLRISSADLDLLKSKAAIEGIPYQTLINSILHKYVTNQLLDKNEILKSLSLLQK